MSPRSVELDVCMVAQEVGPENIGGVTRWADALAGDLPGLGMGMHRAGEALPRARSYHALMSAAVPAAAAATRSGRRPVLLTLHAIADPWEPGGRRRRTELVDRSHGTGGGGRPSGSSQNAWIDRSYGAVERIVAVGTAVAASHRWGSGREDIEVISSRLGLD